jgi:anti-sigma factor RsiW
MNNELGTEARMEHPEFSALIPWYVNDTIDDRQRKHLEAHLTQCAACRADLQLERRVYADMTAGPGVEYMPAPSLKRLHTRLDALDTPDNSPSDAERPVVAQPMRPMRRVMSWNSLMAASVVIIALSLGLFAVDRRLSAPAVPQTYHTVTSSAPRAPDEVIRAVFAPTITLVELQAILDESQLRIVAGPTEAGVYSLAANSDRAVATSLELLRKHATVRFAESTRLAAAPDPSR